MENLLRELLEKIKNNLLLLIGLPIVLGILGYFIQVSMEPITNYSAKAEISLGNYNDLFMNSPEEVEVLLKSHNFLSDHIPNSDDITEIKESLEIDTTLQIITTQLTGSDHKEVKDNLNNIVDGFLEMDQEKFNERQSLIEKNISELQSNEANSDNRLDQQIFLYELENILINQRPAEIMQPVIVSEHALEGFSNRNRAVMGVLVGLTLGFGYLLLPIVFRKEKVSI